MRRILFATALSLAVFGLVMPAHHASAAPTSQGWSTTDGSDISARRKSKKKKTMKAPRKKQTDGETSGGAQPVTPGAPGTK